MSGKEKPKNTKQSSNIWGGRFKGTPSDLMGKINASISFDKRLYSEDIEGSLAHIKMLKKQKIITKDDHEKISRGLKVIKEEITQGKFKFDNNLEDIHMNIEERLRNLIGPQAGKLHTARSRNDQIATDLRMWTKKAISTLMKDLQNLQHILINKAELNVDTIMPGFTHMQIAQPITFGHYLMAYVEMFGRDRSRYNDCLNRLNENPLGSAALAGTSFPIDRHETTKTLKFANPSSNSIDAVSDRDFIVEFLSITSLTSIHLSRLSEEIIIWSSDLFNFIKLTDDFTTGSSIMPQKRNPDAAELVRGKSGRILGSLFGILTVLKGLPLSYSKDLQEDKEGLFDAFDNIHLMLLATKGMIASLKVNKPAMLSSLNSGFPTATDLADILVKTLKIPFREAHLISGKAVKCAEKSKCKLEEIPIETFQKIEPRINKDIIEAISIKRSVYSKTSYGGTAPKEVRKQIKKAKKRYL